jgi:hypothetical protein
MRRARLPERGCGVWRERPWRGRCQQARSGVLAANLTTKDLDTKPSIGIRAAAPHGLGSGCAKDYDLGDSNRFTISRNDSGCQVPVLDFFGR